MKHIYVQPDSIPISSYKHTKKTFNIVWGKCVTISTKLLTLTLLMSNGLWSQDTNH